MPDRAVRLLSGDRFIPKRININIEAANYFLKENHSTTSEIHVKGSPQYINYAYLKWKNRIYQERLWSVLAPNCSKILNFSASSIKKPLTVLQSETWPVRARRHPLIGAPLMVLDMPNLEGDICHHIIDWGSKGHLVSVFEGEIYLWHSNMNAAYPAIKTEGRIEHCVRWNHDSTKLGLALKDSGIGLWEYNTTEISDQTVCICASSCTITALGWSLNNEVISGCSQGRISIWSDELILVNTISQAHMGSIITIALSCYENYLGTTSTDGVVRIWFWPVLKENFEIKYPSPIRGFAWHPWKDSLLAVGGNVGDGSVTVWNASNHKNVGHKPPPNGAFVDTLTWSPITGELVVSYWQQDSSVTSNGAGKNLIVIFSNLDTEVDQIEWHLGRVLYLMWGADGTQLGTAGTDENLCCWDFLGNSPELIKRYKKSTKNRVFTTNGIENLTLFGQCIR